MVVKCSDRDSVYLHIAAIYGKNGNVSRLYMGHRFLRQRPAMTPLASRRGVGAMVDA